MMGVGARGMDLERKQEVWDCDFFLTLFITLCTIVTKRARRRKNEKEFCFFFRVRSGVYSLFHFFDLLPEVRTFRTFERKRSLLCRNEWRRFQSVDEFHLQGASPAIDSGSSTDAPSFDVEDNSRPFGSEFDVGAYEYVGKK
jgi:hypothetical protein